MISRDAYGKDLNALALMVLSVLRDTPEFGSVSRLTYIMGRDDFDRLIDLYGGQTLYIPTRHEVNVALKAILYYYYRQICKNKKNTAAEKSHITSMDEFRTIDGYIDRIDYLMRHFEMASDD